MSRRKLGEKQTLKKWIDIKFRISHTPVHDTNTTTRPTSAANANANADANAGRMKIRSALALPQDAV